MISAATHEMLNYMKKEAKLVTFSFQKRTQHITGSHTLTVAPNGFAIIDSYRLEFYCFFFLMGLV